MILGGDIGGTKTLLGFEQAHKLLLHRRYTNADFPDFASLLGAFFAETRTDPARITGGCLGLAGPISDDRHSARLTNLPWTIDNDALSREFGLPSLRLENDFAVAALGAVTRSAAQRTPLQHGEPLATAPRLVIGAGTGLGMAIVLPENAPWRVIASEGGHAAFGPADARQMALWSFLNSRHGRVTWERVVSGPGLTAIHEFLSGSVLSPESITSRALASAEGTERQSLEMFLSAYGAIAGDMALTCLARGGVFLAGGIISKLKPMLPTSGFMAAFNAKAEHAAVVARMPVYLATDPMLGLRGAFAYARE